MTNTIVAMFDDIFVARRVVKNLVDADFPRDVVSLVTNDANNQYSRFLDENYLARDDAVTGPEGADFGAVVGALTDSLGGAVTLMVPGIRLMAAGPIAAGLAEVVAGTLTGGFVGALVKSGVPEDEAPYYAEGIRRGGTLISVETNYTLGAEVIMLHYGSVNIHQRSSLWRQDGWKGLDTGSYRGQNEDTEVLTSIASIARDVSPNILVPSGVWTIEEPPIDDEDTTKSVPVVVSASMLAQSIAPTPRPDGVAAEPAFQDG